MKLKTKIYLIFLLPLALGVFIQVGTSLGALIYYVPSWLNKYLFIFLHKLKDK